MNDNIYYQEVALKVRFLPYSGSNRSQPKTTFFAHLHQSMMITKTFAKVILKAILGYRMICSLIGLEFRSRLSCEFYLSKPIGVTLFHSTALGLHCASLVLILQQPNFYKGHERQAYLRGCVCKRHLHCTIFSIAFLQLCEHYPF